ncbi:fibronectin-binding protein (FBP) [Porphyromonas canoris]|uniref:SIR2 family protein n=1 Tax=Porphyromonas canoris TaxID=36875 RepID=UPI00051DECBF|nr:SIR2 family protein [Porphyromonas canoris]KGL53843.1 fibronectin-binding protein (FBP) [Porphyromonas canoris]
MNMKQEINIQEVIENGGNVIKTRDDRELIVVGQDGKVLNMEDCSWLPDNENPVVNNVFRSRIEPWLTSLFQSEHLSLLCGSGITNAISFLAGAGSGTTMGETTFSNYKDQIESAARESAQSSGRENGNIEDQIRAANDLLRGLKILQDNDNATKLEQELNSIISNFAKSILESENKIATSKEDPIKDEAVNTQKDESEAPQDNKPKNEGVTTKQDKREKAYLILVNFLLSFASRTGNKERLNIFTTNYDRLIEMGAELAGIHLMDRFVGTMMPIFRSSRLNLDIHYNPPGIRGEPRYLEGVARLTKLHGSVDWVQNGGEIRRIGLPFGADSIEPYLQAPGLYGADALKLMIYPNSAKDRETAEYPYVELFRDFAASICRPNSTLVSYGYGFADEHINRVIHDMLTIPSTHLVIISYNDPIGRILKFYSESAHKAQMSILIGNNLGDITHLANDYLPKSAIDRATIRMAELLQHRMGASSLDKQTTARQSVSIAEVGVQINLES